MPPSGQNTLNVALREYKINSLSLYKIIQKKPKPIINFKLCVCFSIVPSSQLHGVVFLPPFSICSG